MKYKHKSICVCICILFAFSSLCVVAQTTIPTSQFPPWDINKDGVVDLIDLVIVVSYFDKKNPDRGDLDKNGIVDIFDMALVARHFGEITVTLKSLAERQGVRFGAFYQYDIRGESYDKLFESEMGVLTAYMGWDAGSRPSRTEFDFTEMDYKVAWGRTRGMVVYGQSLVWFEEIPDWLKATSNPEVEAVMNEHIDKVVGRYAGKITHWNVVNEAVNDDGILRQGHKWTEAMGNDYIRKAFVRAHAADPTAVLYYNEFDIESNTAKFERVKALLTDLKNEGVPVHALGWQLHVTPTSFDADTLLKRMNEIADLGFDNYITELDVALPEKAEPVHYEQQKQTYKKIVQTFLAARRHKTIVVWGLRDGDPGWLTSEHPLLFDESLARKPAYYGVQEALLGQ